MSSDQIFCTLTTAELILLLRADRTDVETGLRLEALKVIKDRKRTLTDDEAAALISGCDSRPYGWQTEVLRTVIGAKTVSLDLRRQAHQQLNKSVRWWLRSRYTTRPPREL